ncbi:DUF2304 domain-containing protein [Nannocystis bainbridge]|uniref:DUF2304 domain-containing protein n=1 Tax=Nannocystis bainbridge TaxID=2995303 RepID=A0ABT5EBP1_9BACT|nr:DUF2304 domain-containing protein [Nannocystis bainbridge]MDC0723292.1 DUF2304 domain-containing protein [Nannocystis bainbridge]
MAIQFVLIGGSLALLFHFFVRARRRPAQKLAMTVVFAGIIFLVIFPDVSTWCAHRVGVGRGVDLVFYLSSLVLLFLCFNLYLGQKALEDRLTLVVRELALQPHRARSDAAPGDRAEP